MDQSLSDTLSKVKRSSFARMVPAYPGSVLSVRGGGSARQIDLPLGRGGYLDVYTDLQTSAIANLPPRWRAVADKLGPDEFLKAWPVMAAEFGRAAVKIPKLPSS